MKPNDKLKITNEHGNTQEAFDSFWRDTINAGVFLVFFTLVLLFVCEVLIFS